MAAREVRRVLGYVRVSTAEQGVSGLSLEGQRKAIRMEAKRRGWELIDVYADVASARSRNGRIQLGHALEELREGRADALLATKVDRIARSMLDFATIANDADRQGWALVLAESGFDMSTPYGKAMAGMASVFAELEADLISERTRSAMAVAKAKATKAGTPRKPDWSKVTSSGRPIGRPRLIDANLTRRIKRLRQTGQSFEAIAATLTAEGLPTPTGGPVWRWQTVALVARRG